MGVSFMYLEAGRNQLREEATALGLSLGSYLVQIVNQRQTKTLTNGGQDA